jgi:hypothetical protein
MDRTIITVKSWARGGNRLQMTWLTLSNNISVRYPQGYIVSTIGRLHTSPGMTSEAECSAFDGVIEGDYGVLCDAKNK